MKLNREKVLNDLISMIRLKTVSCADGSGKKTDREVFGRFRQLVRERFPVLFEKGEGWAVGNYGLLIRIRGKSEDKPSVLMAHMDVVDADPAEWDFDPFAGIESEGRILGRGALDTKSTLCSILEAMDFKIRNGFVPKHDIWLSFGGEEEICGDSCAEIVTFLKERGVKPAFVLDEGGSVIPEGLPGVRKPAAVIGIAEKGTVNYILSIGHEGGGHASVPPKHTVIGRLSRAAVRIEEHPFPARITEPVCEMFRQLSDEVPVYERPVFKHPELMGPAIAAAASCLGGTFNAMVRTTCAVTIMEGHSAFNVLPDSAAMGVNVRLLPGDTIESAKEYLKSVVRDPGIEIGVISGSEASPVSPVDCDEYRLLKEVILETWPGAIAAPYQLNGGTDSRFYTEIAGNVYRFSPMIMTKEDRASVHGKNEAIRVGTYLKMIRFYIRLIERL